MTTKVTQSQIRNTSKASHDIASHIHPKTKSRIKPWFIICVLDSIIYIFVFRNETRSDSDARAGMRGEKKTTRRRVQGSLCVHQERQKKSMSRN